MIRLLQTGSLSICYALWRIILWLCLVGCLLLFALVMLFTHLPQYHLQIEQAITVTTGYPVQIDKISTNWQLGMPSLNLHGVKVRAWQQSGYLAEIAHAQVVLDFASSFYHRRPIVANLLIHSRQLNITQSHEGQWQLQQTQATRPSSVSIGPALHWLLRQPTVTLAVQQLNWQQPQSTLQLHNIELQLSAQNGQHRLQAKMDLPSHWQTFFQDGHIQLDSWGYWDIHSKMPRLLRWQGDYQVSGWQLRQTDNANTTLLPALMGSFQASHSADMDSPAAAWYIRSQQTLLTPEQPQPLLKHTLQAQLSEAGQLQSLHGTFAKVQLSDWHELLTEISQVLVPQQHTLLSQLQPRGTLDNIHWSYSGDDWTAAFDLAQFSMQGVDKIPAIRGVSGHAQFKAEQGQFVVNSQQVAVHSQRYFSKAHVADTLNGTLHWQRQAKAWRLSSTDMQARLEDMSAHLNGYVDILLNGKSPRADFRVAVKNGQLNQAHRYLPDRRLAEVTTWLQTSLQAGTIEQAELHFQGTLTDVFKNQHDGQFTLIGRAERGKLAYAADWLPLTDINGVVAMHNKHFMFETEHAVILNSQVKQATVVIEDVSDKRSAVQIKGQVTGSAEDGLVFLRENPVCDGVDAVNGGLSLEGQMLVDLDLHIMLTKQLEHIIQGQVQLIDTTVTDNASKLRFMDVNGALHFNSSQINAEKLRGRLFGMPTQLAIHTLTEGGTIEYTRLNFTGTANRQFIHQNLTHLNPWFGDLPIYPHIAGKTRWQAILDIPNHGNTLRLNPSHTTLDIITDLQGMTVTLPAPFAKLRASSRQPLRVTAHLFNDKTNTIYLNYGQVISSALRIEAGELSKGVLQINQPHRIKLPKQRVFNIQGRSSKRTDVARWIELLSALPATEQQTAPLPMTVDLQLAQVNVFGSLFPDVTFTGRYTDFWRFKVKNADSLGRIDLRTHTHNPSVFLDFERLQIPLPSFTPLPTAAVLTPQQDPDPRLLPTISLHAKQLAIDSLPLGQVNVFTHVNYNGLVIEEFTAKSTDLHLQGAGSWYYTAASGHQTELSAQLNSPNAGQLLQAVLQTPSPLSDGRLNIALQSRWASPIYAPQAHQLEGNLSLRLEDGHIVDVEPGAVGRMFGLLAIQALPRRLSLDFSDVFQQGFGFESIAGDFTMQAGFAHTNNLVLQGPAAHIKIQGHTDFVERVYNQKAIVTPHITNTLPVAGALAGGVGGGALALVVQQILQPELEKAMQYKYQITGPWQQPEVNLINPQLTTPAAEPEQETDYE